METRDILIALAAAAAGAAAGAYGIRQYDKWKATQPATTTPAPAPAPAPTPAPTQTPAAGYLPGGQAYYWPAGAVPHYQHAQPHYAHQPR